jgi:hypothetical protein
MRAKELVQEGPIWSGITSKLSGGTYTGGYNKAVGQQQIVKLAKDAEPTWFKTQAAYEQRGVDPQQMGPYLTQWARKWFEVPNLPDYSKAVKSPQVTDQGARQYLQIAASYYMAPDRAGGQQQTEPQQTKPQQTEPQQTEPQQTEPQQTTTGNTTPTTSNVASNTATVSSVDPIHAMFKDPAAFKAEWDKFVASKPNYKLIADPALLAVLKNMWMRSGGLKAESKNNKGKRV